MSQRSLADLRRPSPRTRAPAGGRARPRPRPTRRRTAGPTVADAARRRPGRPRRTGGSRASAPGPEGLLDARAQPRQRDRGVVHGHVAPGSAPAPPNSRDGSRTTEARVEATDDRYFGLPRKEMSPGSAASSDAIPRIDSVVAPAVRPGLAIAATSACVNETCMLNRERTPPAQRKRGSIRKQRPSGPVLLGRRDAGDRDLRGVAGRRRRGRGGACVGVGVTAGRSLLISAITSSVMSSDGSE